MNRFFYLLFLVAITFPIKLLADWTQFRGPYGDGRVGKISHPKKWSMKENLAWSQSVSGGGWSSPIILGEHVFLTTAIDSKNTKPLGHAGGVRNMRGKKPTEPLDFKLICLSLIDGSLNWEKTIARKQPKFSIHPSNTYATESPITDGKYIFSYFAAIGKVTAVDMQGQLVWNVDIGNYPSGNGFGTGSSLTLAKNRLFIQCDNDQESFVLALNTSNGKEAWKTKRSSSTSWSTPFLWQNEKQTDLVVCGSGTVTGYNPTTGEANWQITNTRSAFTASPTSNGEYIFLGNSGPMSQGPLFAIEPGISEDVKLNIGKSPKGIKWAIQRGGPGMASPVVSGNFLYVCSRGFLSCYSTNEGKRIYKSRLPSSKSIAASMWADDNFVFLIDESGKTFVVKSGKDFEIFAENQLDDLFWSTPAISNGNLLLRGANKLYCIRK